ncbi:DNA-binding transcriptional regulator, AcrR family [Mycolicibacterium rutilum]|uniref:DNA-binding transcriptional regulator, AcrR family n=1 Tax=Mycolicibacterium rutilum TaxID=370526 RepID=A0A1H6L6A7_MYCRU|nr:TetR/AcrR family transcriptional regulator [Mycolicibacterium rutilum]SEH83856.1 DNA-binding transcriptional regulator, AcrR family [Mycolicibacterium rutilum]
MTTRPNQKSRTRKDLLQAASRLLREGRTPTLEQVAEEAMVSRATAYRYFPSVDALLIEAPLDDELPEPAELFRDVATTDPIERMLLVDDAMQQLISANERPLRLMLAQSLQRDSGEIPARQNRRTALIEAALAPARGDFSPDALDTVTEALAVFIGTESMVVFSDVLRVDAERARSVRRFAIQALIEAARKH